MSNPNQEAASGHSLPRLVRCGFVQGERNGNQSGECGTCDKTVTRNRSWWRHVNIEYDEWECYCKRCATDYIEREFFSPNSGVRCHSDMRTNKD